MITASTMQAIAPSLATAYGKNGLPFAFRVAYPRRYSSFSRLFIALDLFLAQLLGLLDLRPRRGRRPELRDEVQVRADQRDDRPGDEQHVDRVEARQGGGPEFRA